MKFVPSTHALPAHLQSLVGTAFCKPADGVSHDFRLEDPFLSLYQMGLLPVGCHLDDRVDFIWTEPLKRAVAGVTKSSKTVWDLIPHGLPLSKKDLLLHKRFAASPLSSEDVKTYLGQHAIPLYVVFGLLITLDPTKVCKNSPLSAVSENFIATKSKEEDEGLTFIRVTFNNVGYDKKWVIFQPVESVPSGKAVLFKS